MNRRLILPLVLVAVLIVAAVATRGFGLFAGQGGELVLNGNVDVREVDMAFRVGGRIDGVAVEEGAKVRPGQLLATLDTATVDAHVNQADAEIAAARAQLALLRNGSRAQDIGQAQARLTQAQAALNDADADYARRRPLVETGAISRDIWDMTVATRDRARGQVHEAEQALSLVRAGPRREEIDTAAARLAAAEASRQSISTDRADTRLVAASAGTVVTRAREPGAIVAPGETVLTLSIDRPLRIRAYVGEPDLSRISPGMAVEVTADGNPRTYRGTIGYIAPQAEFTPKTVETESLRTDLVYRVRILIRDPDDALRQGQPVTVRIPSARPAHR